VALNSPLVQGCSENPISADDTACSNERSREAATSKYALLRSPIVANAFGYTELKNALGQSNRDFSGSTGMSNHDSLADAAVL
jgi:hypothetical protein